MKAKTVELKEGQPKLFFKDGIDYPIYVVLIKGKKHYISKQDGMSGKPYWIEVKKTGKNWNAVKHFTVYPYESIIGDNREEAVNFLMKKNNK